MTVPEYIAAEGMELEFVPAVPTDLTTGTISITGVGSLKVSATGKAVYQDGLSISVSNVKAPGAGATIPDPGTFSDSISAKGEKAKAENKLVLREGDESGSITATPQIPPVPPLVDPTDYQTTFAIRIKTAGQDKAKSK